MSFRNNAMPDYARSTNHTCQGSESILYSPASLELARALRLPEVLHLTGDSKSSWYARLNPNSPTFDPDCPRPFRLHKASRGPVLWNAGAVLTWLRALSADQNG